MKESSFLSKGGDGVGPTRRLQEDLLSRIEARAANLPNAVELQVEQAHLLAELGRSQQAAQVYGRAVKSRAPRYPLTTRAYSILPYRGSASPVTVVLLVAPEWGNAPFRKYLDDQTFLTLQIITDFHDAGLSLPPHQLVINCISDGDSCRSSLEAAEGLAAQSEVPWINRPAAVSATTRESNAQRLATVPGVRTPKVATLPREFFANGHVGELLEGKGFSFPLLIRAPGYHTGLHFTRVETVEELMAAMAGFPGESISVIEFMDARSADGQIRKYRVMAIDGKFHPAHLAISKAWKVHFFSSTTPDLAEHRAEDRHFLEGMPEVLGPRVMETLGRIQGVMKLDFWGVDFSVDAHGDILLFEANATMNVQPPEAGEVLSYRMGPVQQIADAVRSLLFKRVGCLQ